MKRIAFLVILIGFSGKCFSLSGMELVEEFSKDLIEIVNNRKLEEFKKIDCVKIPCGSIGLDYIFGNSDNSQKFRAIMAKEDITFKIFGPYTVEQEYKDMSYTIVFYSSSKSPFTAIGHIDTEYGYTELYESFLQTQIAVIGGRVLFQRVPFYLESHHPYVGDYG